MNGGRQIRINHPTLTAGLVNSFRMTVPGNDRVINLAEMEITSGGANVAGKATLTQSSEYNGGAYPISNLVDGERSNFSHTAVQSNPWIEVHMDPPVAIDAITIWNRPGFESRFNGAQFEFFKEDASLATLKVSFAEDAGPLGDPWLSKPFKTARAHLSGRTLKVEVIVQVPEHLAAVNHDQYLRGAEIYSRDGHCSTCHQPDGLGLPAAGFPPLGRSPWVTEDEDRLIMLTLNGLLGPMEVLGKPYPGLVPMTPFGGMLSNEDIAAVLTYVRNSFGNQAGPVTAERIEQVRVTTQGKVGFYSPDELQGGEATISRPFVKFWEMADFELALQEPLKGRDFERGREMFEVATCSACHNMEGRGGKVGADLSLAGSQFPGSRLLRQILEPSAVIKEEHRLHYFELSDGSEYHGQIVERDDDSLSIAESLLEPDVVVTFDLGEIVTSSPLDTSPMPTGLLVTLSRGEVLDLLAYVASNGDKTHPAFKR
jgi:putative heme-binding domain-containing protein